MQMHDTTHYIYFFRKKEQRPSTETSIKKTGEEESTGEGVTDSEGIWMDETERS